MDGQTLFAGIDGGGTKTLAVVVDRSGNEVGRAIAGGSNLAVVGVEKAAAEIEDALRGALAQAGADLPVGGAWAGLAGVDYTGTRDLMLPHLRRLAGEVRLGNDAELVLTALPGAVGIAVIGGTGSISLGRDRSGTTARAGGWGHIIGDEGSGYELGRRALQAVSQMTDGRGPQTRLRDRVLAHWELETAWQMIDRVYLHSDKADIAALSALVFAAAREGDAVAQGLLDDAAASLAGAALAVAGALAFGDDPLPVALAGGNLTHEEPFRQAVVAHIARQRPVGLVEVVHDAALSAARAAIAADAP